MSGLAQRWFRWEKIIIFIRAEIVKLNQNYYFWLAKSLCHWKTINLYFTNRFQLNEFTIETVQFDLGSSNVNSPSQFFLHVVVSIRNRFNGKQVITSRHRLVVKSQYIYILFLIFSISYGDRWTTSDHIRADVSWTAQTHTIRTTCLVAIRRCII